MAPNSKTDEHRSFTKNASYSAGLVNCDLTHHTGTPWISDGSLRFVDARQFKQLVGSIMRHGSTRDGNSTQVFNVHSVAYYLNRWARTVRLAPLGHGNAFVFLDQILRQNCAGPILLTVLRGDFCICSRLTSFGKNKTSLNTANPGFFQGFILSGLPGFSLLHQDL